MKRLAVLQSCYIPWKGYFALIGLADELILYDDAQYTKGRWRNRNRIKTHQGVKWMTIPVSVTHHTTPSHQVEITNPRWVERHWQAILTNYGKALHFESVAPMLQTLYKQAVGEKRLTKVNELFIRNISRWLSFDTKISRSEDYKIEGDRTNRLISLCRQTKSHIYVDGPKAATLTDKKRFADADISTWWMDYSGFPEYRQKHSPPFIHEVSVLDLLLNEGIEGARAYMHNFIKLYEGRMSTTARPYHSPTFESAAVRPC